MKAVLPEWGPTCMPSALPSLAMHLQLNAGTCSYSLRLRGGNNTFRGICPSKI